METTTKLNGTHGLTHPLSLKLEKVLSRPKPEPEQAPEVRKKPDGRAGRYPIVPRSLVAACKRAAKETSMKSVAERLGLHNSALSRILSGEQTRAAQSTIDAMEQMFGVGHPMPKEEKLLGCAPLSGVTASTVRVSIPAESPEFIADGLACRLLRDALVRLAKSLGVTE